jgi:hypothetical protein
VACTLTRNLPRLQQCRRRHRRKHHVPYCCRNYLLNTRHMHHLRRHRLHPVTLPSSSRMKSPPSTVRPSTPSFMRASVSVFTKSCFPSGVFTKSCFASSASTNTRTPYLLSLALLSTNTHHAHISDTVAEQLSPADRACMKRCRAPEINDEQDAPSKQPRHHRPSARPRKSTASHDAYQNPLMLPDNADTLLPVTRVDEDFSWWRPLTSSPPTARPRKSTASHDAYQTPLMLPGRTNTVLPVTEAAGDFSWWRELTSSPPTRPESQSVTALGMTGLQQPIMITKTDREPHIQTPSACAGDDRSSHVPSNVHNSSDDT